MSEADLGEWFRQTIMDTGRSPPFCFFTGMIAGFASIRFPTRMIRAGVRWWPGNVEPGGLHIHHVVFGVVMMLLGGIVGFAVPAGLTGRRAAAAALFGVGSALVPDEFALILRLRDVYWAQEGRLSVEAVFVALAAAARAGDAPVGPVVGPGRRAPRRPRGAGGGFTTAVRQQYCPIWIRLPP